MSWQSKYRHRVGLGAVLIAALAVSVSGIAEAQSSWSFGERRAIAVAPPAPAKPPADAVFLPIRPDASPGAVDRSVDAGADRALAEAVEHLRQGRRALAQRQFEVLVARYPDSDVANRARRLLVELYSAVQAANPAGPAPQAPVMPSTDGATPQSPPQSGPLSKPSLAVGGLRTLQDDLRMVAGDRMFFADGSAEVGSHARTVIEAQARWLKRYSTLVVVIESHGDETTGPADATRLALERGNAIRARLVEAGIEPQRITVRGFGDKSRIALCSEAMCRAQNRRAVIAIAGATGGAGQAAAATGGDAAGRQLTNGFDRTGTRMAPPR